MLRFNAVHQVLIPASFVISVITELTPFLILPRNMNEIIPGDCLSLRYEDPPGERRHIRNALCIASVPIEIAPHHTALRHIKLSEKAELDIATGHTFSDIMTYRLHFLHVRSPYLGTFVMWK